MFPWWALLLSCLGRSRDNTLQPLDFIPRLLIFPLVAFVVAVDIAQEAPEVTLVFTCGFVLGALEGSVADVGFAVLAPVFRLEGLIRVSFYLPM